MERFLVGWNAALEAQDDEDVLSDLDAVMEAMLDCPELIDPSVDYDESTGAVEFEVIVEAEDLLDAMGKASVIVRTCLHAAGVGTPGWPHVDDIKREVRLSFEDAPSIRHLIDA